MNTETFKQGDFVRLTDPINNGQIVRIESVDEHGCASWLGGAQYSDMEQISIAKNGYSPIGNDIDGYYFTLSEIISEIEERINSKPWLHLTQTFKLYPESAVQYWKHRAEEAEAENALNEKLLDKEHNKLLDAQDYIKKVCKESSADILRLDAENKELRESNAALKRQLDESNKQIETYAKKVRNLEAELEEGGFNDERNFI